MRIYKRKYNNTENYFITEIYLSPMSFIKAEPVFCVDCFLTVLESKQVFVSFASFKFLKSVLFISMAGYYPWSFCTVMFDQFCLIHGLILLCISSLSIINPWSHLAYSETKEQIFLLVICIQLEVWLWNYDWLHSRPLHV